MALLRNGRVAEAVPVDEDPLLTPAQVAGECGVALGTIYTWRYRGLGPQGFRVGGQVRYRLSEVRRWLAECGDTAAAPARR